MPAWVFSVLLLLSCWPLINIVLTYLGPPITLATEPLTLPTRKVLKEHTVSLSLKEIVM